MGVCLVYEVGKVLAMWCGIAAIELNYHEIERLSRRWNRGRKRPANRRHGRLRLVDGFTHCLVAAIQPRRHAPATMGMEAKASSAPTPPSSGCCSACR